MQDLAAPSALLTDYGALLRRRAWVIALAILIGVGLGLGYTSSQSKEYTSTTEVLVTATGVADDSVLANGRTRGEINLDTEAQLLTSTAVVRLAAELLGNDIPVAELQSRVRVSVPPNTEVLSISVTGPSAASARASADAFASAYLANRAESASDQLTARQGSRQAQIQVLTEALETATAALRTLPTESAERFLAEAQISSLSAEIATLTAESNELQATPVTPGQVITEATLPQGPSSPILLVNLAGGGMLGLLVGCGLALLLHRRDRRLHSSDDIVRAAGVPVLATVQHSPSVWVAEPASAAGRAYIRLRNVLQASAAADMRTILVAGVDGEGSEVADNLAAALARTGSHVVLVSTHPGSATLRRLWLSEHGPGLSEVLGGQASTTIALQVPAGLEGLRVLAVGQNPGRAAELLETKAAQELLSALAGLADYVIVDAESTAGSSQAQTLAASCQAALLVVNPRTVRIDDVRDAVEQFEGVGTPLLGCVVLSGRRRSFRFFRGSSLTRTGAEGTPLPASDDEEGTREAPRPHPAKVARTAAVTALPVPSNRHITRLPGRAVVSGDGDSQRQQGTRSQTRA